MLAYLNFQNQTATKSKTKEIQRTYMLLFVHTLVDVAVYQLYRAVWKLESYSVWWSGTIKVSHSNSFAISYSVLET